MDKTDKRAVGCEISKAYQGKPDEGSGKIYLSAFVSTEEKTEENSL